MSEVNLAKDAFSYLMQQHIAECMPDPVGEYLQAMVARKAETAAETAKPAPAPTVPTLAAPKFVAGKTKSKGGWSDTRRATFEAKRKQLAGED